MEEWQKLLVDGVNNAKKLKEKFPELDENQMRAITKEYPVRINKYYLDLIEEPAPWKHRSEARPNHPSSPESPIQRSTSTAVLI